MLNFVFDILKICNSENNKLYCDSKILGYFNNKVKCFYKELCCVFVKLLLKLNKVKVYIVVVVKLFYRLCVDKFGMENDVIIFFNMLIN